MQFDNLLRELWRNVTEDKEKGIDFAFRKGFVDWHVHLGNVEDEGREFIKFVNSIFFSRNESSFNSWFSKWLGMNLILNTEDEFNLWYERIGPDVLSKFAATSSKEEGKYLFVTLPVSLLKVDEELASFFRNTANEKFKVAFFKVHPRLMVEEKLKGAVERQLGRREQKCGGIASSLVNFLKEVDIYSYFLEVIEKLEKLKEYAKKQGFKNVKFFVDCFTWGDFGDYSFEFLEVLASYFRIKEFYSEKVDKLKSEEHLYDVIERGKNFAPVALLNPDDFVICHVCSHKIREFEMRFYRPFQRQFWIDLSATFYFKNSPSTMRELTEFLENVERKRLLFGSDWPLSTRYFSTYWKCFEWFEEINQSGKI